MFFEPFSFLEAGCCEGGGDVSPHVPEHPAIVLDKIKAFFKWYGEGIIGFSKPKPEAKGAEKKAAEP